MSNRKVTTNINVSSDPAVMGGAWCIDGTRIPVEIPFQVVDRESIQPEELHTYYPSLVGKVEFQYEPTDLNVELREAVEELVTAVEGLAHRDDTEYLLASPANAERLQRGIEGLALSDEEIMDGLTAIGRCYECGSQNHEGSAHE